MHTLLAHVNWSGLHFFRTMKTKSRNNIRHERFFSFSPTESWKIFIIVNYTVALNCRSLLRIRSLNYLHKSSYHHLKSCHQDRNTAHDHLFQPNRGVCSCSCSTGGDLQINCKKCTFYDLCTAFFTAIRTQLSGPRAKWPGLDRSVSLVTYPWCVVISATWRWWASGQNVLNCSTVILTVSSYLCS